jgi:aryl-alcohol dehydrogenase-like predicted oxidoreductase
VAAPESPAGPRANGEGPDGGSLASRRGIRRKVPVPARAARALAARPARIEHEAMQHAELGRSGLRIPRVVFGAWAIGGWGWGGADDEASIRAIEASIEAGANAFDTAPVYGFGRSEEVLGRALRGRRGAALVFTKIGLRWDDERGDVAFDALDDRGVRRVVRRNARADSVKHEVERSLTRLGVDVIDLIQVHWPDARTPVAETMAALLDLRAAGAVRAIGVSNFGPPLLAQAQDALGDVPLASTQPKYSLVARDVEQDVLPHCARAGIGVIVYSPLEQGLLSGRVTAARSFPGADGRSRRATFRAQNRARVNAAIERALVPVARAHGATPGQAAIAWTLAQPAVTAAIVGARTAEQARENAAAADVVLARDEEARLRAEFESLRLDLAKHQPLADRLKGLVRRALGR